MPSEIQVLQYSPDILNSVIDDINGDSEKKLVQKIVQGFVAGGFSVKIEHLRPNEPSAYYRVLCFIKKSKETVSVNTNHDHDDAGLDLKIRIENWDTFNKLDEFTENVRDQILNGYDCHYCGTKCEGKRYIFKFNGNEYVKCQYLGSNFRFNKINESDIDSIMNIVNGELEYKKTRKK